MRTFACADLHGRLDLFEKELEHIGPEDRVYFLGDAGDRGPDGWTIIKRILDDPRFIYIKGNHEDLMIKALKNWHGENDWSWNNDIELWYWNGGRTTHDAFLEDNLPIEKKIEYLEKLRDLPFAAVWMNKNNNRILLSHAGCDDFETANDWDEEHFIWDRTHNMFFDSWEGEDNEIIVHGHTPIELMIDEQSKNARWSGVNRSTPAHWSGKGAYWYGQGHKVNIDTGAVWNGNTVLLDLDTWEEIILEAPKTV